MIVAILAITFVSLGVNLILLFDIKWSQETHHRIHYKHQHSMWDDITQIGRTVRAIQKQLDVDEMEN